MLFSRLSTISTLGFAGFSTRKSSHNSHPQEMPVLGDEPGFVLGLDAQARAEVLPFGGRR
jgi:hypothetical protein